MCSVLVSALSHLPRVLPPNKFGMKTRVAVIANLHTKNTT